MNARQLQRDLTVVRLLRAGSPISECWPWPGAMNPSGYGTGQWAGRTMPAHRAVYLASGRTIPAGYDLDHICHTRDLSCPGGEDCAHRRCVNPAHLEAVTRAENLRRVASRITHCPHGHEYTEANTRIDNRGHRSCVTCVRDRDTARSRRMGVPPIREDFTTHCANGHEYTAETLRIEVVGGRSCRRCRICACINAAASRARRRSA